MGATDKRILARDISEPWLSRTMWFTYLVILILLVLTGLYLKWLSVRSFWARKNIPHDPPHPIVGSLTFLQKKNAGEWMKELYKKFNKAPYIGIWLFWRPGLVVNDPELARKILIKDADVFRNRHLSSGKSDPIGGLNIFTVNDPTWTNMRRPLTSVFTTAKLKVYTNLISSKAKQLCQRIKREQEKGKPIDLRDVLTDYTTDIVSTAAFGVECDATLTGDGPMRRITRDFQKYNPLRGIAHTCIFFFPEMIDVFRFTFFPKASADYFRKIWSTVVQQRGGYESNSSHDNKDLVDALIKMKVSADNKNEEISEDMIVAQAAILLQGGFETSAGTLTFAIYELAYAPEAQEKLYQEILEIKQRLGNEDFDMDSLANATYLNCVAKETLRKYPPMGWLDRRAGREYTVDESLTIPAKTPVYVNAIAMQMDPDYFPEPEKFIPERFLPENEKNNIPYTYMPFGDGPRVCIGRRFAEQTMRFALAELFLHYSVRPRSAAPRPHQLQLEKNSMFLMPGEIMHVDFVPRK